AQRPVGRELPTAFADRDQADVENPQQPGQQGDGSHSQQSQRQIVEYLLDLRGVVGAPDRHRLANARRRQVPAPCGRFQTRQEGLGVGVVRREQDAVGLHVLLGGGQQLRGGGRAQQVGLGVGGE